MGKAPTNWTEAKYAMRVLDPAGGGVVGRCSLTLSNTR